MSICLLCQRHLHCSIAFFFRTITNARGVNFLPNAFCTGVLVLVHALLSKAFGLCHINNNNIFCARQPSVCVLFVFILKKFHSGNIKFMKFTYFYVGNAFNLAYSSITYLELWPVDAVSLPQAIERLYKAIGVQLHKHMHHKLHLFCLLFFFSRFAPLKWINAYDTYRRFMSACFCWCVSVHFNYAFYLHTRFG